MNKFTNDFGKNVQVPADSEQFKQIMYNLTLNLGIPSAEIMVDHLSTIPYSFAGFNKGENENYLEAWVNQDRLDEDQNIENCFNINPDRPMKFTVGSLFDNNDIPENTEFTFIICKISVGRSLVISHKKFMEMGGNLEKPPQGYDSIFVENEPNKKRSLLSYQYFLFSDTRVQPRFIIKFKLRLHLPEDAHIVECEGCRENAVVYCRNDKCYLCEDCDTKIHNDNTDQDKMRVLSKHERVPISEK